MVDEGAKAWQRAVRELASRLPGEWVVGRPGPKAILVRKPIEWRLVWVGLDRIRSTMTPRVIAGAAPLVYPFSLRYASGLRSDTWRDGPPNVDLLSPELTGAVERFVVDAGLPVVDSWPEQRMTEVAEQQFAEPAERRHPPRRYLEAAGWRVVNNAGSPAEPARQAADECRKLDYAEGVQWFESLLAAWQAGGRSAALTYLEEQRAAVLDGLNIR